MHVRKDATHTCTSGEITSHMRIRKINHQFTDKTVVAVTATRDLSHDVRVMACMCLCHAWGSHAAAAKHTPHTEPQSTHHTLNTAIERVQPASSKCFRLLGTHCRQARPPGPGMPFLLYQVSALVPSTGNSCYAGIVLYPFSHSYLNFSEAEN